jgi:hypothetical protein
MPVGDRPYDRDQRDRNGHEDDHLGRHTGTEAGCYRRGDRSDREHAELRHGGDY